MTALALSRSVGLKNSATSFVVLASNNKLKQYPMIPLEDSENHHHNENISLPNVFKPSSFNSLKKILLGSNLKIYSPFTSIYNFFTLSF